jgi:hypothetical protein
MKSLLRVSLALALGLVLLWRGMLALDDRLTRPSVPPRAATPRPPKPATPAPQMPAESDLRTLRAGDEQSKIVVAWGLRGKATTPELLQAVGEALPLARDADLRRLLHCFQARSPQTPLQVAFDALPDADPTLMVWNDPGSVCLVEVVAERALEDPERATTLLVERALQYASEPVLRGLRRLDPAELPEPVALALQSQRRLRRVRAVETAIALGAAAKWPEIVHAALEDGERVVRVTACRALAARSDGTSLGLLARAIVRNQDDAEVGRIAERALDVPATLDLALADVAADQAEPPFARGETARLVGLHGSAIAVERLARAHADDPALRREIDTAVARARQRLGLSAAPAEPE